MRTLKDTAFKNIFANHRLMAEFLRDYSGIDLLKTVREHDIEDLSERFVPASSEHRDSDTVKRVRLPGHDTPCFVITILEHQSRVDFRMSFRMLFYIALVLDAYEKEANAREHVTGHAAFRYPPVLPIVFYDGVAPWTAQMDFRDRVYLSDVFGPYIPSFKYLLVDLNEYTRDDILKFGDVLSYVMMVDKIRRPEDIDKYFPLPAEYVAKYRDLDVPEELRKLLASLIRLFFERIDAPAAEAREAEEIIYKRSVPEMFEMVERYSVRETRQKLRAEMADEVRAEVRSQVADEVRSQVAADYETRLGRERMKIAELEKRLRDAGIDP